MRDFTKAKILRCIAQDLDRRCIKAFDIRNEGDCYVVQCGYQDPPASMPVTLEYTTQDIETLDRAGKIKRGTPVPRQDFVTLVQVLRAVGSYVDKSKSLLLRVCNNLEPEPGQVSFLQVEYQTPNGAHVIDRHDGTALHDLCVRSYKQRGRISDRQQRSKLDVAS